MAGERSTTNNTEAEYSVSEPTMRYWEREIASLQGEAGSSTVQKIEALEAARDAKGDINVLQTKRKNELGKAEVDRDLDEVQVINRAIEIVQYTELRDMTWRALNPTKTPDQFPDDAFELSPEMKTKAGGFVTARQEALRAWNMAAILGQTITGRKKDFSDVQREQMLRDLDGTISASDYQILDTALKQEKDPSYKPPLTTGDTALDSYGVGEDTQRAKFETLYAKRIPELRKVEEEEEMCRNAGNQFYGELGQNIFNKERPGAIALILRDIRDGDETKATDEQKEEIIKAEGELKKRIAVRTILQSMRRGDQDFEKMKQEQFLESADQKERGRLRKTMEAFWGNYQALPMWKKVLISAPLSAGIATGTVLLAPTIGLGGLFVGSSAALAKAGIGSFIGWRTIRSVSGAGLALGLRKWSNKSAEKKYGRERDELQSAQTTQAIKALNVAREWIEIAQDMQTTGAKNEEEIEKLKGSQWWRRMGRNIGIGLVAGVAVGLTPKIAGAVETGLGSGNTTPGKGIWPDESRHLAQTVPTAPPADLAAKPSLPPDVHNSSSSIPKSTEISSPETKGSGSSWYDTQSVSRDSTPGFFAKIRHLVGLDSPSPKANQNLVTTPSAENTTGTVTPEKIGDTRSSVSGVETARSGKGVWNMLGDKDGQLHKRYGPTFDKLFEPQKRYVIDAFKDKVVAKPTDFGLKNPNLVRSGQQINFSKLFENQSEVDTIFKKAKALTPEQMQNIMRPHAPVAQQPHAARHQPSPKIKPRVYAEDPNFASGPHSLDPQSIEQSSIQRGDVRIIPPSHKYPLYQAWAFRGELKGLKDIKALEFIGEVDRLAKLAHPLHGTGEHNVLSSTLLPDAYQPGKLSRLERVADDLDKILKKLPTGDKTKLTIGDIYKK